MNLCVCAYVRMVFGTVLMRNAICVLVVKHTKIATPNECAAHQQTVHVMSGVRVISSGPVSVYARMPDYIAQCNTSVLYCNSWASVRML